MITFAVLMEQQNWFVVFMTVLQHSRFRAHFLNIKRSITQKSSAMLFICKALELAKENVPFVQFLPERVLIIPELFNLLKANDLT